MSRDRVYLSIAVGLLVLFVLYLTRLHSYLLFHSLAEIFSIAVASAVFMFAWNARRFLENSYLLFIGIAYLFVGGLDALHTLSYKGMGVFQGYGTDLPTQLWIAARYIQSLSLLIAPAFLGRRIRPGFVLGVYAALVFVLVGSIFYWDFFPSCFVEGRGLTPFKKGSEYAISLILVGAIIFLVQKRKAFDVSILRLLVASVGVTICSELAFTFYVDAYDFSNLIGHYLKIMSFYLIYKAIIATGLTRPYALLFRDLKKSEEALRESEERYRSMMEGMQDPVYICGHDYRVTYMNPAMIERVGSDMTGQPCYKVVHDRDDKCPWCAHEKVQRGQRAETDIVSPKDGRYYHVAHSPLFHTDGTVSKMTIFRDMTDQKQAEEALLYRLQFEKIIAEVSSRFIRLESKRIDEGIHDALDKIGRFARVDGGYLFTFSEDKTRFSMTHLWRNEKLKTDKEALQNLDAGAMAWWMGKLKANEPVIVSSVRKLPGEAHMEKGILASQGIQAVLDVPMVSLGELIGFLGVSCVQEERGWSDDEITLLKMAGQVFANAIQRMKSDDALKRAHDELERRVADRTAELKQKYEQLQSEIRKRQQAYEALGLSRRQYEELWEKAPVAYHTLDTQGVITRVNETEAKMFGYEKAEMVGKPIFEFILPEQREDAKRRFGLKIDGRQVPKHENRIYVTRGGRRVHVAIDDVLERDQAGNVVGVRTTMVDVTEQKQTDEALRVSEAELRRLSGRLLRIQEDERRRIARELHDSIGQSLAAVKFVAENALNRVKQGEARGGVSALESLIPLIQGASDEVRKIHTDLRPSLLDDLGIISTLSWFCREFERLYSGIHIEKKVEIDESEVPEGLGIVIFRVLQEALNNVAKHGRAEVVTISLRKKDGRIEFVVQDNGQGFDLDRVRSDKRLAGGFGLTNMKERTELSGGTFTIESSVGQGTTVHASWPVDPKA